MAVTNEKVIRKMINELKQALELHTNQKTMRVHISNVKVLCELLMEDDPSEKTQTKITEEEMRAMIGGKQPKKEVQTYSSMIDEEANGSSIFDF